MEVGQEILLVRYNIIMILYTFKVELTVTYSEEVMVLTLLSLDLVVMLLQTIA